MTEKCEHVWVSYYSTKTRQCIDCLLVTAIDKNKTCGLTEHKRHSGIGKQER
jgi:hypothetical protein